MTVPHQLPEDEALRRIQGLLSEVKSQFANKVSDLSENWDGGCGKFSFKVKGYAVSGTLSVQPTRVRLIAELPWQAALFRGTIETRIREKANELLA